MAGLSPAMPSSKAGDTMSDFVLAIDQGTTSTRAILFDGKQAVRAAAQEEFTQHYPGSGWVEHDPEEIWQSVISTCRTAIKKSGQRGLGYFRDRHHQPARNRRHLGQGDGQADPQCDRLAGPAHRAALPEAQESRDWKAKFTRKTGLLLDPYFSGTKIAWLLDHVKGARRRAERGELLAGTIDSFLIWRLTGGRVHATDATNASRTLVYNIQRNEWDAELLRYLAHSRSAAAGGEGLRRRLRRHRTIAFRSARSRSSASPATSRRRRSGRPVSSPA